MSDSETNNDEKLFLTVATLGAIFGFVIPLIMWILKKENFSEYAKKLLLDLLNFELIMLIITLLLFFILPLCESVPILKLAIVNNLVRTCLFIFNLVVVLRVYSASQEQKEYSFPINIQLIK